METTSCDGEGGILMTHTPSLSPTMLVQYITQEIPLHQPAYQHTQLSQHQALDGEFQTLHLVKLL